MTVENEKIKKMSRFVLQNVLSAEDECDCKVMDEISFKQLKITNDIDNPIWYAALCRDDENKGIRIRLWKLVLDNLKFLW